MYTLLWGGDYSRGAIIRGGATIQGNTVLLKNAGESNGHIIKGYFDMIFSDRKIKLV